MRIKKIHWSRNVINDFRVNLRQLSSFVWSCWICNRNESFISLMEWNLLMVIIHSTRHVEFIYNRYCFVCLSPFLDCFISSFVFFYCLFSFVYFLGSHWWKSPKFQLTKIRSMVNPAIGIHYNVSLVAWSCTDKQTNTWRQTISSSLILKAKKDPFPFSLLISGQSIVDNALLSLTWPLRYYVKTEIPRIG